MMGKRGFTLIEVLIASLIFTTVMIAAVAVFLNSNRLQDKSSLNRDLVEQSRYAMEAIVRDVRSAKDYTIGPTYLINLTTTDNKTVTYSTDSSNAIVVTRDNVTKPITDASKYRALLNFTSAVIPNSTVWIQPYVHVQVKLSAANVIASRPETQGSYMLETTISLRNFVKEY